MFLEFTKMNGAGNDFILIDDRMGSLHLTTEQIVRLCDRNRGIGADGLILLKACGSGKADWAWDFYNSDGSTGEMCGNGARCFARFVQSRTAMVGGSTTFETGAGVITAQFHGERVAVNLTNPKDLRIGDSVRLSTGVATIHSINTGVPHAVIYGAQFAKGTVLETGAEVRRHPHFGERGTNVNFVEVTGPNEINVRTFERGVEGETLACGTGVTASALISACVHGFTSPVRVRVLGGDVLDVSFSGGGGRFDSVKLTGPADFVFTGRVEL